jgi:hypothetical protein
MYAAETSVTLRIKRAFWRHEMWALNVAERFPLLSIHVFFTLCTWGLPLVLLNALFLYLFMLSVPLMIILFVPNLVIGMAFWFFVGPWLFRWYFICAGLMFGRPGMAHTKRSELEKCLSAG